MAEDDIYTQDGTITISKKPANKKKTGNWKACYFILGNECCERLAYYGMSTNLVNYLQERFNQGNVTAANNVTTWSGTCYITPLIGAFLADSYLGRYWTIASFSVLYAVVSSENIICFESQVKAFSFHSSEFCFLNSNHAAFKFQPN
ncbi:unnamed protein product [Sphenostylis stenocarpa]|uniref:Uncharacterized protein n=1 Tax=Sphenostylis stenocarpa TaxID=92480 RepID=A0AA86V8P2_9FABA|nr:unnamed protein product [Sphenostylis stenocarpa]